MGSEMCIRDSFDQLDPIAEGESRPHQMAHRVVLSRAATITIERREFGSGPRIAEQLALVPFRKLPLRAFQDFAVKRSMIGANQVFDDSELFTDGQ